MSIRPPGRCVFCGSLGLTRQHVWAARLLRILPPRTGAKAGRTDLVNRITQPNDQTLIATYIKVKRTQQHLLQRTIRKVCSDCNGGWIRDAETAALMVLEPIIQGASATLSATDLQAISFWIAIVLIMAEYSDPETAGISDAERKHVFETRSVPPGFTISLGRYDGGDWAPTGYRHQGGQAARTGWSGFSGIDPFGQHHFQTSIFVLGALVVHAHSSDWQPMVDTYRASYAPGSMIEIFPEAVAGAEWV
jgi:hypothetical protein